MKKILSLILAVAMLLTLCACGGGEGSADSVDVEIPEGQAIPDDAVINVTIASHASWPYREDWKVWEYIEEGVGGTVNVTAIPGSDWGTKFPIIMASPEDFPDLLAFMSIPRTFDYCEQGAFLPLDDYEKYMPDYVNYCNSLPEEDRWMIETRRGADGKVYFAPIFGMEMEKNIRSWLYRKDIFEKHNLKPPTNFNELYEVCKKLKVLYPDSYPLCMRAGLSNINVIGSSWKPGFCYGVYYDFEAGKFVYGATEDVMFELVSFFSKMVTEKLIPANYFSIATSEWEEYVLTNRGFIFPEYQVRIDYFNPKARAGNPEFTLTAMVPPVANEKTGVAMVNKFNYDPTGYAVLNTGNEGRIANAFRYLNWFYTDEACEVLSWGKEGETYEVVDGKKQFILDENDAATTATLLYGFKSIGSYTRIDKESLAETVSEEQYATTDFCLEHTFPEINPVNWMTPTTEESNRIAEYNTSISTVVTENIQKFILGQRPLSEWDAFQKELSELPIQELLNVYEGVYERVK